ncbi:hypothetical protein QBC38DRAFT_359741, partial [Podospora fimiseda]
ALEMFTAALSSTKQEEPTSVVISSTYYTKSKTSLAVIYNCNSKQKQRIQDLLDNSPEASTHPLLLPGLFAELQRDRLERLVELSYRAGFRLLESLRLVARAYNDKSDDETISREVNDRLRKGIMNANFIQEEVCATRQQLERMIRFIPTQSLALKLPDFFKCTMRYEVRFEEILMDIDNFMAHSRIICEDLRHATDFLTRQETARAGRQAKVSTVIAFVAMLYLPMTSVANIFAMPIFGFQNKWLDIYFKLANTKSDSDNNTPGPPPVLSGYFWIYLAVSISLTGATVGFYVWYTGEQKAASQAQQARVQPFYQNVDQDSTHRIQE